MSTKLAPVNPPMRASTFTGLLLKWFIGFIVLGFLLVSTLSFISWEDESRDMRNNLAIQAGFAAKNSQSVFDVIGISMEMLGQLLAKIDAQNHPELARSALLEYKDDHPEIIAVSLISPAGVMLLSTNIGSGRALPNLRQDVAYLHDFLFDLNNTYSYSIGRIQSGMWVAQLHFPFRHTVHDSNGNPLFVIQAAIPLTSAELLWSDLPLYPGSRVGLIRDDGDLQLLWPDIESGHIYNKPQEGAMIDFLQGHPGMISGAYEGVSGIEAGVRLGAYSHLLASCVRLLFHK